MNDEVPKRITNLRNELFLILLIFKRFVPTARALKKSSGTWSIVKQWACALINLSAIVLGSLSIYIPAMASS